MGKKLLLVFLVPFLPPPPPPTKKKKIFFWRGLTLKGGGGGGKKKKKKKRDTLGSSWGLFRDSLSFGLRGVFGVSSHHPGSARLHLWAQAWTGTHIITAAVTSLRGDSYLSRRQNFISRPASTRPYSIPSPPPHPTPLSPPISETPLRLSLFHAAACIPGKPLSLPSTLGSPRPGK